MQDARLWVGLDLGEMRTSICVIGADGAPLHESDCETSVEKLHACLSSFALGSIELIAVEAGSAPYLIRKLRGLRYPVAIFEARKASRFLAIRKSKTDASDARGLADLARLGVATVSQVHLKSVDCQQLRSELVLRQRLVRVRVAIESSIRSYLLLHGLRLKLKPSVGSLRRDVEALAQELLASEGIDIRSEVAPLIEFCESLRGYLRDVDRRLEKRAKEHPICSKFMEIPGVGHITALSFYSAIENPARFARVTDVGAYLGLVPRRLQSGELSRTVGITKNGNRLTRMHLITAALALRCAKRDCALRDWANSLAERAGPGRARVGLARKLAVVMLTMWQRGDRFVAYPMKSVPQPRIERPLC